MDNEDRWGDDPSVRSMRMIFADCEKVYNALLAETGVSPFDSRIGEIREKAKALFEKSFSDTFAKNCHMDKKTCVKLYRSCLVREFDNGGIKVPEALSRDNGDGEFFLHAGKEV